MTDKPKPICRECKHHELYAGSLDVCRLPDRVTTDYISGFTHLTPCNRYNSMGQCEAFEPMPLNWFHKFIAKL